MHHVPPGVSRNPFASPALQIAFEICKQRLRHEEALQGIDAAPEIVEEDVAECLCIGGCLRFYCNEMYRRPESRITLWI